MQFENLGRRQSEEKFEEERATVCRIELTSAIHVALTLLKVLEIDLCQVCVAFV